MVLEPSQSALGGGSPSVSMDTRGYLALAQRFNWLHGRAQCWRQKGCCRASAAWHGSPHLAGCRQQSHCPLSPCTTRSSSLYHVEVTSCHWWWRQTHNRTHQSSCANSQSLFLGTLFYRGFKFPALTHLTVWGLNTTQFTGQWHVCVELDWLQPPVWISIWPIIIIPRDLFTSTF